MKSLILASVLAMTALAGILPSFVTSAEAGYWVGNCYYGGFGGTGHGICYMK